MLIAIDIKGDVYPCETFWGREDFRLGTIGNATIADMLAVAPAQLLAQRKVEKIPRCSHCPLRHLCCGGCPARALRDRGTVAREPLHCSFFRELFAEIIWRMSENPNIMIFQDLISPPQPPGAPGSPGSPGGPASSMPGKSAPPMPGPAGEMWSAHDGPMSPAPHPPYDVGPGPDYTDFPASTDIG